MSKKMVYILSVLFIFCFIFSYTQTVNASSQKIIGVLEFNNTSGRRNLNTIVTDSLVAQFSQNPRLKVIDRVNIDEVLNEQGLGRSGLISSDTAAQVGRIIGLNYIVIGTVTDARIADHDRILWNQSSAEVSVSMQIIDINSGAIVFADSVNGSVDKVRMTDEHGRTTFGEKASYNEYTDAAQNASKLLADHFNTKLYAPSISAYVAAVDGDRVYLNVGANRDIVPGQIFIIYQEGKQIHNPITGELLGLQKKERCQITIDNVEDKMSSGSVTSGDISGIQVGDKASRQ